MKPTICLDFDGVLHDPYDREPGYKMGKPLPGAVDGVTRLVWLGASVVVHTARTQDEGDVEHVIAWLHYFDFPWLVLSVPKPRADLYVDDQSWPRGFLGWFMMTPEGMVEQAQINAARRREASERRSSS